MYKRQGLEVEQITEPVFTIREISEETASITVEYLVNYIRQGRETYASVEEVYRVRQGTDRMYLLDYEDVYKRQVKKLAPAVLAHRLVFSFGRSRQEEAVKLMEEILKSVPVPVEDFSRR